MEELVVKSIATIGIPGAICFFLLIKFSRSIDGLTNSINSLIMENQRRESEIERYFVESGRQFEELKEIQLKIKEKLQ